MHIVLESCCQRCYIRITKGTIAPYKGLAHTKIEIHPRTCQSIQGWFFYACFQVFIEKCYLQLTKIKVSNATMNIPKAIRSLKSYFIRTTSHLCNMGGQRPCSDTIVPCHYGNISHFNVQLLFPAAGRNGSAAVSRCSLAFCCHFWQITGVSILPMPGKWSTSGTVYP